MKDEIGDRMKSFYENRTRFLLQRRSYTILRIDGKAFHTYTRGMKRPFDEDLIADMNATAKHLCENIQGAKFGYVQSDEISILLTDFDDLSTHAWFDGNLQKIVSISASMATACFNQIRYNRFIKEHIKKNGMSGLLEITDFKLAHFDSRAITYSSKEEAVNYFVWRQQDAVRNSITSVAQSLYSHKQLEGVDTNGMQELIFQKGQNWNNYPIGQKRGRAILRTIELMPSTEENYNRSKDKSKWTVNTLETLPPKNEYFVQRRYWNVVDPPTFTKDKDFIKNVVPTLN